MNVLFVCSLCRLRSPTAEQVFASHPGWAVASAGINEGADDPVTPELLDWADIVFVMEKVHRTKLGRKFAASLRGKRIICLDIPDDYDYMEPKLVDLLSARVPRRFRS